MLEFIQYLYIFLELFFFNKRDGIWGIVLSTSFSNPVRFLDTTLRDGEQTPGVSLTPDKKLQIACKLDQLGVDVIEAGFAAVSDGEYEAVKQIAKEGLAAEICSATRSMKKDIDVAIDAGVDSVNIICDPREYFALTGAIKIFKRHAVYFISDVPPEFVRNISSYAGHYPALNKIEQG